MGELDNAFSGGIARGSHCIVSLGTGVPTESQYRPGIQHVKDWIDIATNSEKAALQFGNISKGQAKIGVEKWHRLNLSKALSDKDTVTVAAKGHWPFRTEAEEVGYEDLMKKMDDWEAIPLIRTLTDKWLSRKETQAEIEHIAKKLLFQVKC